MKKALILLSITFLVSPCYADQWSNNSYNQNNFSTNLWSNSVQSNDNFNNGYNQQPTQYYEYPPSHKIRRDKPFRPIFKQRQKNGTDFGN